MPYVDGFVIPVRKDRIDEYEKIAREAAAVWREHGALSVTECIADDVPCWMSASVSVLICSCVPQESPAALFRPGGNGTSAMTSSARRRAASPT